MALVACVIPPTADKTAQNVKEKKMSPKRK